MGGLFRNKGTSMGKKDVRLACRDCKKCTNSDVANFGRNAGRVTAGIMTAGMSEVGFLGTKRCRQCEHPLSLHAGEQILSSKNKPASPAPNPTPVPASHFSQRTLPSLKSIDSAGSGLSKTDISINQQTLTALPHFLDADETAVLIAIGQTQEPGKFLGKNAAIVLTDRCLWVIRKDDTPASAVRIDYRTDSNVSITYRPGMLGDTLSLEWPGARMVEVFGVSKNGRTLPVALEQQRSTERAIAAPVEEPTPSAATEESPVREDRSLIFEELKQLGELHKAGVLTDDEFTAQKARLLGQL